MSLFRRFPQGQPPKRGSGRKRREPPVNVPERTDPDTLLKPLRGPSRDPAPQAVAEEAPTPQRPGNGPKAMPSRPPAPNDAPEKPPAKRAPRPRKTGAKKRTSRPRKPTS